MAPVALPVRLSVAPWQTGEFELADTAVGVVLIITVTVAVVEPQPFVAVSVYVPAAAVVAPAMLGFCEPELKPLGPLQL